MPATWQCTAKSPVACAVAPALRCDPPQNRLQNAHSRQRCSTAIHRFAAYFWHNMKHQQYYQVRYLMRVFSL